MLLFNYTFQHYICKLYFCLKTKPLCVKVRLLKLSERIGIMSFDIQLKNLMKQINDFKASEDNSLPQNTFYLNENQILCCERDYGVSRFAYDANGLVVWARSSGHIDAYDSTFTIFRELNNFEDASIAFMGGLKQENGEYFPVSLFECHRQLFENIDIKILIKDTTLINIVKEQTERYLFTLNNSRIFSDL